MGRIQLYCLLPICLAAHWAVAQEQDLFFVMPYKPYWPQIPLDPAQRHSSYPYLAGDTFRAISDFILDETKIPFYPSRVIDGDIIFVHGNCLEYFFTHVHHHIKARYILLTHNSLFSPPGKYTQYLDDKQLVAWFGREAQRVHPKMIPIPLGIANNYWPHGNCTTLESCMAQAARERTILLYMNFEPKTNSTIRDEVAKFFADKPFCTKVSPKPFQDYLTDLGNSTFVISPAGAGIDCHRTWEALLMGAIPIITHSHIDELFEQLPVLIIDNWAQITPDFLEQEYQRIQAGTYDMQRLYADYWIKKIEAVKQSIKCAA